MADDQRVQCKDCGYLSWLETGRERKYHEVAPEHRQLGDKREGYLRDTSSAPHCFRGVPIHTYFSEELTKGANPDRAFLTVIEAPRECTKLCSYSPGKSPEQHEQIEVEMERESQASEAGKVEEDKAERRHREEMIFRIREGRRQRDWQDAQVAEQRRHEKAMADAQADRDKIARDWQERQTTSQWWRELIRLILSGVGAIALSVLTYFAGQWVEQNKKAEKESLKETVATESKK